MELYNATSLYNPLDEATLLDDAIYIDQLKRKKEKNVINLHQNFSNYLEPWYTINTKIKMP